jgi:hypothetical protein
MRVTGARVRMRPGDRQSYTSHPMYRPGWPDKGRAARWSCVRPIRDVHGVSATGQVERARCACERHR